MFNDGSDGGVSSPSLIVFQVFDRNRLGKLDDAGFTHSKISEQSPAVGQRIS